MNKIIFLENLGESFRLTESNGYDFLNNIEKFCYELFNQDGRKTRTFAFVLNDNHNNYFAELLSNNLFIKDFDKLVGDKITVFWCEPKILAQESSANQFEHFVRIRGIDPTRLWSKLVTKLKNDPYFEGKETDTIFPALFLMSIEKQNRKGIDIYPITDMYCASLNAYEYFDNVDIFKAEFIKLFKDVLNIISNNVKENKNTSKPLFTIEEIKKEIIKEVTKIAIKSDYTDLLSFVKDLFENIG